MASITKTVSRVTAESSQMEETCMNTSTDISDSEEVNHVYSNKKPLEETINEAKKLKLEELKWDNSFVQELPDDTKTNKPPRQLVIELLDLDPREFDDGMLSNYDSKDYFNFKSWREFPHVDDFDLEQVESREHKRWMERENVKLREKARKEEYGRIRSLVDNAYKRDPRLIRRKEEGEMLEDEEVKEDNSSNIHDEEEDRRAKDVVEVATKRREEALHRKTEMDFQRDKDNIERLEDMQQETKAKWRHKEKAKGIAIVQAEDGDLTKEGKEHGHVAYKEITTLETQNKLLEEASDKDEKENEGFISIGIQFVDGCI
eukprot:Gb_10794 [translate_table: standard]